MTNDFDTPDLVEIEESPVITVPTDPEWVSLLEQKLADYESRVKRDLYRPPEMIRWGNVYKRDLLSELLQQKRVETFDFSRRVFKKYYDGKYFDISEFENACEVVDRYCTDLAFLRSRLQY